MTNELPAATHGINIYNEKSLHADLKQWYAQPGDQLEVRLEGYIIDLVHEDLLVEIQTGSFSPLKLKLARLVTGHRVRLVYPIPLEKWIITLPQVEGQPHRRRKSPRRGRWEHVFTQLVYIPALLGHENFSLEVLLTREEEVRRPVLKKHRRHKGWVTVERRLLEVVDRRVFKDPSELAGMVPEGLSETFTVRDLAKATSQPVWLARKMIYCLREMGLITACGRKSRAFLYTRALLTAPLPG